MKDDGQRSAAFWRDRAEEARAYAAEMASADGKKWMLEVAGLYDRLAKHTAETEAKNREAKKS